MALSLLIVIIFILLAEKISALNPCTNRPVKCDLCKLVVWSYNIRIHYEQTHPNNDLPEIYLLKNDEVEKLKALEFKQSAFRKFRKFFILEFLYIIDPIKIKNNNKLVNK